MNSLIQQSQNTNLPTLKEIYDPDIEKINAIFKDKKIISVSGLSIGSNEVCFNFENNETITMYAYPETCEVDIQIEDISGITDLKDCIFYEILEKKCDKSALSDFDISFTWTFYTIKTSKGYLDIRWYGTSNGYYSESIDFFIRPFNEELLCQK